MYLGITLEAAHRFSLQILEIKLEKLMDKIKQKPISSHDLILIWISSIIIYFISLNQQLLLLFFFHLYNYK